MSDEALKYVRHVLAELDIKPTALAKMSGLSSTTLTRPLDDDSGHPHRLSRTTIEKIEAATGIPFHGDDIARVENGEDGPDGHKLVPVYDVQASAGFGALVDYEEQTHSLAFPPDYLRKLTAGSPKDLVIISTKGDSMEPTLLDDDIVLVDTSKTHMGFEGMFVLRHNDTLLVKRAGMAARPGHVMLISDNKAYPPVEAELANLTVVGKVLWYGRKV